MDHCLTVLWEVLLPRLLPSLAKLLGEQLALWQAVPARRLLLPVPPALPKALPRPSRQRLCAASAGRLLTPGLAAVLWLRSPWQAPECIPLGSGHTQTHAGVLLCSPSRHVPHPAVFPTAGVQPRGTGLAAGTALRHRAAAAIAAEGLEREHITVKVAG